MPAVGPSSQTTPARIRGRHRSDPLQERAAGSALGSLLVSNTAPLRVRHPSAPSGPQRVSAEHYPPVTGSPDAMRQTTTLRALHHTMDGVRRALHSGDTGAGRHAATALLRSGVQRRLVLDLQLSSATPELRQAGVEGNLHWLEAVTGLVREQALPAADVIDYFLVPGSDGHNAPSNSRHLRDPALCQAYVTLLDTLHGNDSINRPLAAMRERARGNLMAAGSAPLSPRTLDSVIQQACEATNPVRLATLESSLLRRSVDANMPDLITASEAEAVERMVLTEFQRGGPDALRDNPFFQSTPSRARTLEAQIHDARTTYTREIGSLRGRQGDELVTNIQQEYEAAVLAQDPVLSNVQRGALLRQLSGEAVQGIDEIVHIFNPDAEADKERPATVRGWTGAGSLPAALVEVEGATWRLKQTGDSGLSSMEVSMSKVFRMTGLQTPDTRLADPVDGMSGSADCFASRYEPSFKDLGEFLASDQAAALAAAGDEHMATQYQRLRDAHQAAIATCAAVLQRGRVEKYWQLSDPVLCRQHAEADQERFDALEAMNRLLPIAQRSEQVRHFIGSRWIGNWDHLNFRMENFGHAERDGRLVGMTVDLGSSGTTGFPTLDAQRTMLPKQASVDIAMRQRPASLFPIPDAYLERAGEFDMMGADPGALHDTLRWPYGFQSESIAELLRPPALPDPAIIDAAAEMGYRFALIPASAIHEVIAAHWRVPAGAPEGRWPEAAQMAALLVQRRDALLAQYDPTQIADWIGNDPQRAEDVRSQVAAGLRAALGHGADAPALAEQEQVLRSRHARLANAEPADAAVAAAATCQENALTGRLRTLQRLHNCAERLAAALEDGNEEAVRALGEELLSPTIAGELLRDLELGPGTGVHGRASFEAIQSWLLLTNRLVQTGALPAASMVSCLLEPFADSAYPPNIGAQTHQHHALGMAYIDVLETLIQESTEVTPDLVRELLLTTKVPGFPNYYSALAASGASKAWDQRLQQAGLLPDSAEYIRHRSLWSWVGKAVRDNCGRGEEPIELTEADQQMASTPLSGLVQHVQDSLGPQRVVELELPLLRQEVYAGLRWTSAVEDDEMRTVVERSVAEEWRKAIAAAPLPRTTPLPTRMVGELQEQALSIYREGMKTVRQQEVEALIKKGEAHYRDAVLADAAMPLTQRRELLRHCADQSSTAIRNLIRNTDGADRERGDAGSIVAQVQLQGQVGAAAAGIVAEAQQRAEQQAQQEARQQARQEGSRQARSEATRSAQRAATQQAESVAAMTVAVAARHEADRAAKKEARTAAARVVLDEVVKKSLSLNEKAITEAIRNAPAPHGAASSSTPQTQEQIELRAAALWPDPVAAPLRARLAALREDAPEPAAGGAGRQRERAPNH